eukprot:CAMPEP_0178675982 /NCGR_PEP_ID=MMETSP0698-20121128/35670_1 /TAXON_ID=265572 /ORGANISM="Extubocellulus spinifer, Strain CCMP396" /LENGTH=165 /DNA_ID=CAMNT_0020320185 /DNA_START=233 /DNA_END=731 /DNA_ORIENTATION=+
MAPGDRIEGNSGVHNHRSIVNISTRLHIHLTGSKALSFADAAVTKISHLPRVVFAAVAYIVALYFDCRRSQGDLAFGNFLKRVGVAFLRVAPVYPFLAVAISFVFLFIISAFEALHLPLEILNLPANILRHAVWPILLDILYREAKGRGEQWITPNYDRITLCEK